MWQYNCTVQRYNCTVQRYNCTVQRYNCIVQRYHCTVQRYKSTVQLYCTTVQLYCTTVLYKVTTVLYNCTAQRYKSTVQLYCTTVQLYCTTVLHNGTTVLYNYTVQRYNCTVQRYNCTIELYKTGRHTHCCCITMSFHLMLDRCWFSVSPSGRFNSGTHSIVRPENADGIATGYRLDYPGIESRCVLDFSHRPDRPWAPTPPNCTVFPVVKRPERGVDNPSTSNPEFKERIELHLHSPSENLYPVVGYNCTVTVQLYCYCTIVLYVLRATYPLFTVCLSYQ